MDGSEVAEFINLVELIWGKTYIKLSSNSINIRRTDNSAIVGTISFSTNTNQAQEAWMQVSGIPTTKQAELKKALTEGRFSNIQVDTKG